MTTIESIEHRLERAGHRLTSPRRSLLEAMLRLGERFTAEELANAAPEVGRATVFRTLRLMQEVDAVCQVVLDDGAVAYRMGSGGHHHHVICSECGDVSDFAAHEVERLLAELGRRSGYEIDSHRLELYGRCARCANGRARGR